MRKSSFYLPTVLIGFGLAIVVIGVLTSSPDLLSALCQELLSSVSSAVVGIVHVSVSVRLSSVRLFVRPSVRLSVFRLFSYRPTVFRLFSYRLSVVLSSWSCWNIPWERVRITPFQIVFETVFFKFFLSIHAGNSTRSQSRGSTARLQATRFPSTLG